MAASLTRTLLAEHRRRGALKPGEDVTLAVSQVLIEDATGSMTCMQFEALDVERVAVDLAVLYVDHNVLQIETGTWPSTTTCARSATATGSATPRPATASPTTCTLSASPGRVVCSWCGLPLHHRRGGRDARGRRRRPRGGGGHGRLGFDLVLPASGQVELTGALPDWVEAKDVILELLRRHGVRRGSGAVFEFTGEGVATCRSPSAPRSAT